MGIFLYFQELKNLISKNCFWKLLLISSGLYVAKKLIYKFLKTFPKTILKKLVLKFLARFFRNKFLD